jgi:hypothetical protein
LDLLEAVGCGTAGGDAYGSLRQTLINLITDTPNE